MFAFKDDEESITLLPDYLENIVGDVYLSISEFAGDNYVHLHKFYNDRGQYLRAKYEGDERDEVGLFDVQSPNIRIFPCP